MILGLSYVVFFPLGLDWYFYVGSIVIAGAIGLTETSLFPFPRRAGRTERPWPSDDEKRVREIVRKEYHAVLEELWTEPDKCPICGGDQWRIGEVVEVPVTVYRPSGKVGEYREAYHYLPSRCDVCAYTIFFRTEVLDDLVAKRMGKSPNPARQPSSS
jgi:hypothetical protein